MKPRKFKKGDVVMWGGELFTVYDVDAEWIGVESLFGDNSYEGDPKQVKHATRLQVHDHHIAEIKRRETKHRAELARLYARCKEALKKIPLPKRKR